MPNKIPSSEIEKEIKNLKGWTKVKDRDAIRKNFKFTDFKAAWAFMSEIATYAEEINHHPEWFNVYNKIEITLNTHDVGGLSDLDIKMAQKIDSEINKISTQL